MDHVAIMRKSWGLLPKILTGEKTIESRWYLSRKIPWNRIKKGDRIFFKNSGEPVVASTIVKKVIQYDFVKPKLVREILKEYGNKGLGIDNLQKYYNLFKGKNYCILVFYSSIKKIKPFKINKEGHGALSAWITVENINKLKN